MPLEINNCKDIKMKNSIKTGVVLKVFLVVTIYISFFPVFVITWYLYNCRNKTSISIYMNLSAILLFFLLPFLYSATIYQIFKVNDIAALLKIFILIGNYLFLSFIIAKLCLARNVVNNDIRHYLIVIILSLLYLSPIIFIHIMEQYNYISIYITEILTIILLIVLSFHLLFIKKDYFADYVFAKLNDIKRK